MNHAFGSIMFNHQLYGQNEQAIFQGGKTLKKSSVSLTTLYRKMPFFLDFTQSCLGFGEGKWRNSRGKSTWARPTYRVPGKTSEKEKKKGKEKKGKKGEKEGKKKEGGKKKRERKKGREEKRKKLRERKKVFPKYQVNKINLQQCSLQMSQI